METEKFYGNGWKIIKKLKARSLVTQFENTPSNWIYNKQLSQGKPSCPYLEVYLKLPQINSNKSPNLPKEIKKI